MGEEEGRGSVEKREDFGGIVEGKKRKMNWWVGGEWGRKSG